MERRLVTRQVTTLGTLPAPFRTEEVGPPFISESLLGHWDMGSPYSYPSTGTTLTDLKAVRNGTLTNGPTFAADRGGLIFDGTNQWVDVGSGTDFNSSSGSLSVEIVMYHDGSSSNGRIVSNRNGTSAAESYSFAMGGATANDHWNGVAGTTLWFGYRTTVSGSTGANREAGYALPAAGLYHAIGTNETGAIRLYVNGAERNSNTASQSGTQTLSKSLAFGRAGAFDGLYWPGRLYLVRIYNRTLSAAEVFQNYQSVRGRFGL